MEDNPLTPRHMEIAAGITNTCHESYSRTSTKLGPETFRYVNYRLLSSSFIILTKVIDTL